MHRQFLAWLSTVLTVAAFPTFPALADTAQPTAAHPLIKLPSEGSLSIIVVRGPAWKMGNDIDNQVRELTKAKDFNGLDALADKLRKSRGTYPNGIWYLEAFYNDFLNIKNEEGDAAWQARIAMIEDWIKQKPTSPTARAALAKAWISFAWRARGSGYADSVTKEGWAKFEERLHKSEEAIKQAEALPVKCPELYVAKLILAKALSWEKPEFNKVFDTAVKFEPSYMGFYREKMVYLLPRWSGEQGEFEKFISARADKLGGKAGDIFYAEMVWRYNRDNWDGDELFKNTTLSYARAKKGLQFMIKDAADPLPMQSELAELAVIADDMATAKEMFTKMGNRCDLFMWKYKSWYISRRQAAFSETPAKTDGPDDQ